MRLKLSNEGGLGWGEFTPFLIGKVVKLLPDVLFPPELESTHLDILSLLYLELEGKQC